MRLIHSLPILRSMFPAPLGDGPEAKAQRQAAKSAAADMAMRWSRAAGRTPELMRDVIALGGVLQLAPRRFEDGVEVPDPIDPARAAFDAGRRDMAVQILALMGVTNDELARLMEATE